MPQENIIHKRFPVLNMSCAACAVAVERALQNTDGVQKAQVNYATQSAIIDFDERLTNAEILKQKTVDAGYDMVITKAESSIEHLEELNAARLKKLKSKTILALTLSAPLMLLSMVWHHWEYSAYFQFVLATIVIFLCGRDFYVRALKQLRHGKTNMDTLVALSTGVAWVFSTFNTFYPQFWTQKGLEAHVYFEAAAMVIAFVLLGKLLEENAKGNTGTAIKNLMGLQPKTATIKINEDIRTIAIEDILPNDVVLIKPGERIAIDGIIIEGNSYIDESMISGEPMPQSKAAKDKVFAGTINQNGSLTVKALKAADDTLLAHIIRSVQDAQGSKAPVQKLVDKIAAIFVPIVIVIAIIAFLIWNFSNVPNSFTHGLLAMVTVLVIACPCALGLATPTALMVGIGKAAEQGILIKDAESLEQINKINTIILDKTGTITEGKPRVSEFYFPENNVVHNEALASLESLSEHPLASAIVNYLNIAPQKIKDFKNQTGLGVTGFFNKMQYFAGNKKLLENNNIFIHDIFKTKEKEWLQQSKTIIWFSDAEKALGIIAVEDQIKNSSKAAMDALKQVGIQVIMATGDNAATAQYVAQQVGIAEVHTEVLPQDKADIVQQLHSQGKKVAMVGDGINDSNALAMADVGIAMGKGSDIAMDVAKMTIISSDLLKIPEAIKLSHQTVITIRQNLFWAFIYNVIGIPLATGMLYPVNGFLLDPMLAGAAMALSSVCVVGNSLLLKIKK